MPNEISDPANARPIDIRRERWTGGGVDLMHANRRFADDKKLALHSTASQKIVMDRNVNSTGLIHPLLCYEIGGSHYIAEALSNAVRRHPPGLSG